MRPEDLSAYSSPSDPQLHPDGIRVAYVVTRMDLDRDRYERRIWLWDGERARPFTAGPGDTRPRWSPDGSTLAFLRSGADPKSVPQAAVIAAEGGEASVLTGFALGATEAEWSPSGDRIAVIGVEWTEEWADHDEDERNRRPRRIRRAGYRYDNLGWRHDRTGHVYLVDPGGEGGSTALTSGEFHHSSLAWRPDGEVIAALAARHERRGIEPGSQAWGVPVGGGDPEALVGRGLWYHLSYDRSGAVHLVGIPDPAGFPGVLGLHRVEGGSAVPVAPELDRNVFCLAPAVTPPGPHWLQDGSSLNVVEDRGRLRVVRIEPDGSVRDVLGGDRLITGIAPDGEGSSFVFTATTPTDPGMLCRFDGSREAALHQPNAGFRTERIEPIPFTVEHDGVEIDAWAYLPRGEDRVPLLLNIHGGPATQYGYGFFDEFQVYASAGYGVIACNPRGSSGRGTDYVRVPVGIWDRERPEDLEDLVAVVDAALERFSRLDESRMGVMGGSYGGFMTARILAVDDRWRSAVPERGLYSFTSFSGTSDIGQWFPRWYLPGWGDEAGWGRLWKASPLARAHLISTPCLLVHSETDLRCPIEQAEQLHAVLLARGVESEILRFPGESHELSRSGKPKHRRERFEAILEWHARHLS